MTWPLEDELHRGTRRMRRKRAARSRPAPRSCQGSPPAASPSTPLTPRIRPTTSNRTVCPAVIAVRRCLHADVPRSSSRPMRTSAHAWRADRTILLAPDLPAQTLSPASAPEVFRCSHVQGRNQATRPEARKAQHWPPILRFSRKRGGDARHVQGRTRLARLKSSQRDKVFQKETFWQRSGEKRRRGAWVTGARARPASARPRRGRATSG